LIIDHEMSIIDLVCRRTQSAMTSTQGGAVAKALAKGSRISGSQRTTLATQYAKRYAGGESIRKIADDAGRSYGFVHNVLKESGVSLRGRGGATRGTAKKTASASAAKKASSKKATPAKKTTATKAPAKQATAKKATAKKTATAKAAPATTAAKKTAKKAPAKTAAKQTAKKAPAKTTKKAAAKKR
jgi:Helix-turn-helix domain